MPEVYECVLSGTLAGQFCQTVQHVHTDFGPAASPFGTAKEIGLDLVGADQPIMQYIRGLPEDYEATSLRVRRVAPTGGPTAIILAAEFTNATGERTGTISSAQVAPLLIFIPTTLPAKVGKVFYCGVSEDDIDEMALVAGLLTAMNNFGDAWTNGGSVGGGNYVGCVYRRLTLTADDIADHYVSPHIGTQRRRLLPV